VHRFDAGSEILAEAVLDYSRQRMSLSPVPLDGPKTAAELFTAVGQMITAEGLGGEKTLRLFADELAQACISTDSPRYLSFIPCAPTEASVLFDLVVSASCLYGGTWMEGAGAVYAENEALAWLAGRRLRSRRHDRQPLRAGRGPAPGPLRTGRRPAAALGDRRHRSCPFVHHQCL
jgi:L-2,4-diaminobutyrate decarboxylase